MSFKRNELDKCLYNDISDNLIKLLEKENDLSTFLLGFCEQ